jgi:HemY protein
MLWSLIKILVFVGVIGLLAIGAGYLLESSGGVQVTVSGIEYTFGPLASVIAILVLMVGLWLLLKLMSLFVAVLKFLSGDETAISRLFDRNRERKGYKALTDGMMALASGEGKLAMSKAAKAEKYLQRPDLTNLITAQAAEMAGDTAKAAETYKKLIADDSTRFVGVRGIMKQKLVDGDTDTARKLAEKAFQLKPRHEETQDVLLKLQAQANDWAGARSTLSAKLKYGALPRDVYTRREAVLALSEARDLIADGATMKEQEAAIQANKLSPDLIPAASMAARAYIRQDKKRYAVRVLKKAWEARPHPDLAAAFAEIEPRESPQERIKRFTTLTNIHPDDDETRLIRAELNIVAEDFPEARRALGDLPDRAPDARSLTLMAAIEKGEGAPDAIVKGWLAKALNAPRGPQWVCDNCNNIHADWRPVCERCGGFDTLAWERPQTAEVPEGAGTSMLPLIVGKIEGPAEPGTPETPDDEIETVDLTPVEDDPEPERKPAA